MAEGGWTAPEKNMRESVARVALAIGSLSLAVVIVLLVTGGFETTLWGRHISLHNGRNPAIFTCALIAIWLLLSDEGMSNMMRYTENVSAQTHQKIAYAIGVMFALYLSYLKANQYFTFQSGAYDLGIQANVTWNTAHGHLFYDSIQNINYLGDHFSPIHLLLAFIYRLWESAVTLLIVQSVGIGLAATALYLLTLKYFNRRWPAIAMTILFLCNSYLHQVSTFDFHPIALAIPIFLWLLYFIERERYIPIIVLSLLAMTVEETLLPPLVGIGLYIFLFHKRFRLLGFSIAILATVYFILVLGIGMPLFLKEDRLTHIGRYSNLGGNTLSEIAYAVLRNPLIFFSEAVVPYKKVISLFWLLLSVGLLPLLAVRQLLLLVLPISLIIVSNFRPQWQFAYQYTATILPFLFFGAVHGFHRLHCLYERWSLEQASVLSVYAGRAACLAFVLLTAHNISRSPSYVGKWSTTHVEAIATLIREIPPTASVCATQNFVPHLINRHQVSMLGRGGRTNLDLRDAEYLLLDVKSDDPWVTWPLGVEEYQQSIADIRQSNAYVSLQERDGVVLLKRTTGSAKSD